VAREISGQRTGEGVKGENFSRQVRRCILFVGFARRERAGSRDATDRKLGFSASARRSRTREIPSIPEASARCDRGRDRSAKLHQVESPGPITRRAILHVRR